MPSKKTISTISNGEYGVKPVKKRKIVENKSESFSLSSMIYNYLYVEKETLPFTIHNKKFEEAEIVFRSALASRETTICVVVKGPTGSGKGYLVDQMMKLFKEHLREASGIDSLTSLTYEWPNPASSKAMKIGTSLFPSLSFAVSSPIPNLQQQQLQQRQPLDCRKVVSRLTDAHFFASYGMEKDYAQIRRAVDMLKTNSGSLNGYVLKVLKEAFTTNFHLITLNSSSATIIKKTFEPLARHLNDSEGGFSISSEFINQYKGDSRAILHDLFIFSLNPNLAQIDSIRDYRTDFFHYVGKLLYPAKTGQKIFEQTSFWDLDFEMFVVFLQYYFVKFCPDLDAISGMNETFCEFDSLSWKVLKHVSIESHKNALKYSILFECFWRINRPDRQKPTHKFFSFSKPPAIEDSNNIRKTSRKLGLRPEEHYFCCKQ